MQKVSADACPLLDPGTSRRVIGLESVGRDFSFGRPGQRSSGQASPVGDQAPLSLWTFGPLFHDIVGAEGAVLLVARRGRLRARAQRRVGCQAQVAGRGARRGLALGVAYIGFCRCEDSRGLAVKSIAGTFVAATPVNLAPSQRRLSWRRCPSQRSRPLRRVAQAAAPGTGFAQPFAGTPKYEKFAPTEATSARQSQPTAGNDGGGSDRARARAQQAACVHGEAIPTVHHRPGEGGNRPPRKSWTQACASSRTRQGPRSSPRSTAS